MTEQLVIGANNRLPWHLPTDLAYFRRVTLGKPVLMGRKTFESIGRPLPQRRNIIITRQKDFVASGCEVAHSLTSALRLVAGADEVFIIGGAQLYQTALEAVDYMYITWVHAEIMGDTYFPQWNSSQWEQVWREDHGSDADNNYAYSFEVLKRLR